LEVAETKAPQKNMSIEEGKQAWGSGSSKGAPAGSFEMGVVPRELPPLKAPANALVLSTTLGEGGALADSIAELVELNRLGLLSDDECRFAKQSLLVKSGLATADYNRGAIYAPLAKEYHVELPAKENKLGAVEDEPAISKKFDSKELWEQTKKKADFFAYKPPGGKPAQRSAWGVLGSVIAVTIICVFLWASITQYANDVTALNAEGVG
jgi:hypothetical protein